MYQLITRSSIPVLTKCKYEPCNNLVSNVNQRTRTKEYCSKICRDKTNNEKKMRGYHSIRPSQYDCEECHQPIMSNVTQKSIPKRFCGDCKVIRLRRKSLERYHRSELR